MANNIPFQAMGKTVKLTANASVINTAFIVADSPVNQFCLVNHSSQPAYVWLSPGTSPRNVALPTGSNSDANYAIVLDKNSRIVITGPQCSNTANVYVSVLAENDGPEVYITPGEGF